MSNFLLPIIGSKLGDLEPDDFGNDIVGLLGKLDDVGSESRV